MIDTGQFDRFRVVATQPFDKCLDGRIEIEDQATSMSIAYHALKPEERCNPRSTSDRRHQMQTRSRIKHQMPGGQLDLVRAVIVLDGQLAAIILLRLRQEQSH